MSSSSGYTPMQELIPVVNKLQDVFSAIGQSPIDLPQIVVVGSQSSGKSSVLENIVGRDFLPRGTGIVTRRPLVLQLYNNGPAKGGASNSSSSSSSSRDQHNGYSNSNGSSTPTHHGPSSPSHHNGPSSPSHHNRQPPPPPAKVPKEWGEFLHIPGQRFYNFTEIRDEIVRETDKVSGPNKGISSQTINLRIHSPHVLNLTLVDLPGITKVALGDQPADIEEQIRSMCMTYISNPNAIILAITAANTDLANSDSLQMARQVDPQGDRTVGVLTKLDLMDPGTDASDMLHNRVIPLKRGFVGVVNRGQRDIEQNVTIRNALSNEMAFFRDHPGYRALQSRLGTATLSKTLNQILMHHIRDCLPEIKAKLNAMMQSVQQELSELGTPACDSSAAALGPMMLNMLSKFATNFAAALDGRGSCPDGVEMNELYGGARISYIFHEIFSRSLDGINPFDGLTDQDIRTAIYNANGTRPSLFVPELSFDLLVRKQIARIEQPGLQCADLVFDEMQRIGAQCESTELSRFPGLKERVVEVVMGLLRKCLEPTQVMITNLIKLELAYINTSHPDFIGGSRAVAKLMENKAQSGGAAAAPQGMSVGGRSQPTTPKTKSGHGAAAAAAGAIGAVAGVGGDTLSPQARPQPQQQGKGLMSYIFGGGAEGLSRGGDSPQVKLPQVPETMRQSTEPTDRERIETEIIKSLMESYFDIVRKNFQDMVPKTVMHFLVNETTSALQNELVSTLYKEHMIPELMRETEDIEERRRIAREMFALLQRAVEILNEVRDFNCRSA